MVTHHQHLEVPVFIMAIIVTRINPNVYGNKIYPVKDVVSILRRLKFGDDKDIAVRFPDTEIVRSNSLLRYTVCRMLCIIYVYICKRNKFGDFQLF